MTHSYRCIIHPHHNKVGVCALCLRERLVALDESHSSSASDGAYHSFSSSSARDQFLSPPAPLHAPAVIAPGPAQHNTRESSGGNWTRRTHPAQQQGKEFEDHAMNQPTSFLHKLKLKALSIPPSPDRSIPKQGAGFFSPSPRGSHQKNKLSLPLTSRKSSASDAERQSKVALDHDHFIMSVGAPASTAGSTASTSRQKRTSLRSLFHQSEVVVDASAAGLEAHRSSCKASRAHSQDRKRGIEQLSAAMRSPGFSAGSRNAALSDYRQTYTAEYLTDHVGRHVRCGEPATNYTGPSSSSSWISSLFQRRKHKSSKCRSSIANEAAFINGLQESSRTSVDVAVAARVSMDAASTNSNLKEIMKSRQQLEEAETMTITTTRMKNFGRLPLAEQLNYSEQQKVKDRAFAAADSIHGDRQMKGVGNTWDFPARCSVSIDPAANLPDIKSSRMSSRPVDEDELQLEEEKPVRHFPRSRSWGRAWSRTLQSSSPLWGSKQQPSLNSSNNLSTSSLHHHYLTSTPKHPSSSTLSRDSRVGFGFYFSPFRRSRRQGAPTAAGGKYFQH